MRIRLSLMNIVQHQINPTLYMNFNYRTSLSGFTGFKTP